MIRTFSRLMVLGLLAAGVGCVELRDTPGMATTDSATTDAIGTTGDTEVFLDSTDSAVSSDAGPRSIPISSCVADRGICNIVSGDGCSAEQSCYPMNITGTSTFCARPGVLRPGATCTNNFDCVPGSVCLRISTSSPGFCLQTCCGDDHPHCRDPAFEGSPGSICLATLPISGVRACVTTGCNPYVLAENGCSGITSYCIPSDEINSDAIPPDVSAVCTIPSRSGGRLDGEVCLATPDCAPGFICLGPTGGTRSCRRRCDLANPNTAGVRCPSGRTCREVTGVRTGSCS